MYGGGPILGGRESGDTLIASFPTFIFHSPVVGRMRACFPMSDVFVLRLRVLIIHHSNGGSPLESIFPSLPLDTPLMKMK